MKLLDRVAGWLDRREVSNLRREVIALREASAVARVENASLAKKLELMTEASGAANLRASQWVNTCLALKRRLREAGLLDQEAA